MQNKSKENRINYVQGQETNKQNARPKQNSEKEQRNLVNQKPQPKGKCGNDEQFNKEKMKRSPKREAVDKEIDDMAKKIRTDNEKRLAQLKIFSTPLNVLACPQPVTEVKSEDWTSVQGQFGWAEIANTAIPYLIRLGEKYVSLRMAENRIFARYKNIFTDEVRSCFRVKILHATSVEAQLLNEINFRHCDNFYGRLEFTMKDGIVSLNDVRETYDFLSFCHLKLVEKISVPQNRCGFIKIATQNCVPYVWHVHKQYVPLFYFEGECKYLEDNAIALTGWDLVYLKLYCKIQGIRKVLYDGESVRVVELELVKKFFPPDTLFEENWPDDYKFDNLVQKPISKVVLSQAQSKTGEDSVTMNQNPQVVLKEPDTAVPQRELLIVTPNITPTVESSVKTTVQNKVTLTQPPASTTTKTSTCLINNFQIPQLKTCSSQHIPRFRSHVVTVPGVPTPRTTAGTVIPIPNGTDHHKTQPLPSKVGPPVTVLNTMNYRPFLAKPLTFPGTYQRGSRILQIPEVACNNAYFIVKTHVEDKCFQCCINLEPFMTTILLVRLEECASFFQLPLDLIVNAVNVMNLDIFLPNGMQKKEFEKFKVYSTRGLLKVREFIDNLPQLRYILNKSKSFDK